MRRFLLHTCILLTVFLLASCRPHGVLSTQKLTDVLFDIHLVESMTDTTFGDISTDWTQGLKSDYFTDLAYQSILKKHDVTEEEFYNSIAYYSKNLRLFTRIYSDLGERYEAYGQRIDTWTVNKKTELAVKSMLMKDDSPIKAMFERMHVKQDTSSRVLFSYLADSVKATNRRYVDHWYVKPTSHSATYRMVTPKAAVQKQQSAATDSLSTASNNGATVTIPPTLQELMKRPIPMDELLKLKAEGVVE